MLMPSIFGENLFDDFFNDFPFHYDDKAMKDTEKKLYGRRASHIMKTDIKETDKGYELVVDLPGFTKDEVAKMEPSACINCGRCVEACPSRLIPSRLADYAEHHDEEKFTKHEGLECMECGSCSFVCPAKRPLKQAIGSMRKIALANRRKKK